MIVPISAVFAAVLGLLLIVLSLLVVRYRLKAKKGMGVTEDKGFEATVRAQANLAEYAPTALIMLAIAELNGVPSALVYWTGMGFVVGRLLHAFGMINGRGRTHIARFLGIILSWLAMLVLAALLLWNVYQVYG